MGWGSGLLGLEYEVEAASFAATAVAPNEVLMMDASPLQHALHRSALAATRAEGTWLAEEKALVGALDSG